MVVGLVDGEQGVTIYGTCVVPGCDVPDGWGKGWAMSILTLVMGSPTG